MTTSVTYISDISGDEIKSSEVVEFRVIRSNDITVSHISESELANVMEDEPTLELLVLHD